MNDETKTALDELGRRALPVDEAERARELILWVRGEPARLAAAREAAIMEWRAGAADRDELRADCERRIAAAADELRTLRARVAELEAEVSRRDALIRADGYEDMRKHAAEQASRAEKAEAALAEAHERLDEFGLRRDGTKATLVEGIAAMRTRIDEYRADWYRAEAQVAAARAACDRHRENPFMGTQAALSHVLRAMDEASTTK